MEITFDDPAPMEEQELVGASDRSTDTEPALFLWLNSARRLFLALTRDRGSVGFIEETIDYLDRLLSWTL